MSLCLDRLRTCVVGGVLGMVWTESIVRSGLNDTFLALLGLLLVIIAFSFCAEEFGTPFFSNVLLT